MKNRLLSLLSLLTCLPAFAVYQVGDQVADMCWQDSRAQKVCLQDSVNNVRVLLYNTGWCGPCNQEFQELIPRVGEYNGKAVLFISLSAQEDNGSSPSTQWLQDWKSRFNIPDSVVVAASPNDAGRQFGQSYIPNVAILDGQGKLLYKAVNPGVDGMFSEINKALGSR